MNTYNLSHSFELLLASTQTKWEEENLHLPYEAWLHARLLPHPSIYDFSGGSSLLKCSHILLFWARATNPQYHYNTILWWTQLLILIWVAFQLVSWHAWAVSVQVSRYSLPWYAVTLPWHLALLHRTARLIVFSVVSKDLLRLTLNLPTRVFDLCLRVCST